MFLDAIFGGGFLVKKWDFMTKDKAEPFPYSVHLDVISIIGVKPKEGIKGQNNDNPRSYFSNHAVVESQGQIYDPSYGNESYDKSIFLVKFEEKAIAGYCKTIEYKRATNDKKNDNVIFGDSEL